MNAPLPLIEKKASWERLRTFGHLPLFGVSFSAVVAIPVMAFFIGVYNEQLGRFQQWASTQSEKNYPLLKHHWSSDLQTAYTPF